jgi:hypothetical protein
MQWSIGSYVTSSGVMLLGCWRRSASSVFQGPKESVPVLAYLVMTAVSGFSITTAYEPKKTTGMPLQTIAVFFVLNFAAMSTIVLLVVISCARKTARKRSASLVTASRAGFVRAAAAQRAAAASPNA